MICIEKILHRRTIRKYKNEKIPDNVKSNILEAGRQAPSASNRQPWHFILIEDKAAKEKLSGGKWSGFIKDSSFTIIGVSLPQDEGGRKWGVVDVTIALQNMVIAAEVQGVGSCWVGDFVEDEIKREFSIPREAKVVALISFGLPDETPGPRSKKMLNEILHLNRW
jgi:nitroreductase